MRISRPLRVLCFLSRAIDLTDSPSYVAQTGHRELHVPPLHEPHWGLPALSFHLCRCLLDISPQLLRLGGRTPVAAAAASGASAAPSVSTSYSASSRSASAAGPCVVVPGAAAAPAAALDKPLRYIALPAVASAAGRDDHACCLLSPW